MERFPHTVQHAEHRRRHLNRGCSRVGGDGWNASACHASPWVALLLLIAPLCYHRTGARSRHPLHIRSTASGTFPSPAVAGRMVRVPTAGPYQRVSATGRTASSDGQFFPAAGRDSPCVAAPAPTPGRCADGLHSGEELRILMHLAVPRTTWPRAAKLVSRVQIPLRGSTRTYSPSPLNRPVTRVRKQTPFLDWNHRLRVSTSAAGCVG